MPDDPDLFVLLLRLDQLVGQEAEHARSVRVGRVDEHKVVAAVPHVGVEGDDAQAFAVRDRVACIMGANLVQIGGIGDSALLLE